MIFIIRARPLISEGADKFTSRPANSLPCFSAPCTFPQPGFGSHRGCAERPPLRYSRRSSKLHLWLANGNGAVDPFTAPRARSFELKHRRFLFRKNETRATVFPCRFNDPDPLGPRATPVRTHHGAEKFGRNRNLSGTYRNPLKSHKTAKAFLGKAWHWLRTSLERLGKKAWRVAAPTPRASAPYVAAPRDRRRCAWRKLPGVPRTAA